MARRSIDGQGAAQARGTLPRPHRRRHGGAGRARDHRPGDKDRVFHDALAAAGEFSARGEHDERARRIVVCRRQGRRGRGRGSLRRASVSRDGGTRQVHVALRAATRRARPTNCLRSSRHDRASPGATSSSTSATNAACRRTTSSRTTHGKAGVSRRRTDPRRTCTVSPAKSTRPKPQASTRRHAADLGDTPPSILALLGLGRLMATPHRCFPVRRPRPTIAALVRAVYRTARCGA